MKLYYAPPSPFARKVRLCAHAVGVSGAMILVAATPSPVADDAELSLRNPLGKVPTLELEDGRVLFDSRVIVEFLDEMSGGGLLPARSDPERFATLRLQAVVDGLLDAALAVRYETILRPPALIWPAWVEGQQRKVAAAIAALEADAGRIQHGAALNGIAAACALGYLDFRFPDWGWRKNSPRLDRFFDDYAARPEMVETAPAPGFR